MLRNKKILITLILISLFVVIFIVSFYSLAKTGKANISITYAPADAIIKIDGKEVKYQKCTSTSSLCVQKVYVKKGVRDVSLSMDNFSSDSKKIDTTTTKDVVLIVTPINPAGEKYYKYNSYAQTQTQNASSAQFDIGSEKISQRYPFLDKLNLYGSGYTVGYGASSYIKRDPYSVAIYIEATEPEYREKAIKDMVSELGVSPADIEIIYNNFSNPFKEAE